VGKGERRDYETAIGQLAAYLQLSDEAIQVAEGWSILSPRLQRHVKLLIDDYISSQAPVLKALYANTSHHDQLRFNRIVERLQNERRGLPPSDLK
jgi:hypothetical protein